VNQGGTARWLEALVLELRSAGHEVSLFAGSVQENEIEDKCFQDLGGKRVSGLGRSVNLISDIKAILIIRSAIKNEAPDVINTHTAKAGVIGRIAAIGTGIKVVHTFHGHLLYGYFPPQKTKIVILIEKFLARFTDQIIAVGSQVKEDLLAAKIGSESQYFVISPAIPFPTFYSKIDARRTLGVENNTKVIGWLGRLTAIKRPDRVIELAKCHPSITFVIGGTGELFQEISNLNPGNIKMLGWVQPEIFWPCCDIALLTSDNEGLPTALIEAGLAGLPTIAENIGSVSEIIKDGLTGILVKGDTERDSALIKLLADSDLSSQMGISAQEYCKSNFGSEIFLSAHLLVYNQK
jgi:glycosyltransferase involved in cell wall biosynthesis